MAISKFVNISICSLLTFLAIIHLNCHGICSVGNQDTRTHLTGGNASISQGNDSIRVGDTLWVKSSIPTTLTIQGSNQTVNFSGASNMITQIEFLSLVGINNNQIGSVDSFKYIYDKGTFASVREASHSAKSVSYLAQNGSYVFSLGIIAQKKGIYYLAVIDIYQAEKKCLYASVEILMNNANSNLHYLKDIYYGGGAISPYDSTHAYCFKVY